MIELIHTAIASVFADLLIDGHRKKPFMLGRLPAGQSCYWMPLKSSLPYVILIVMHEAGDAIRATEAPHSH